MPSLATTQEEWVAGSAVHLFSSGTGRYASHVGKGDTCSTLVVWLRPLQEAQHRHNSAAQQSTAKLGIQDGSAGGSGPSGPGYSQSGRTGGRGDNR